MSKHGFVYVLGNAAMPGLYKIGFTTNSPFQRAEELSRATGVPSSFQVICFAAFYRPEFFENLMHKQFANERVPGKEFFRAPIADIFAHLKDLDCAQCFCDVESDPWVWDEERSSEREEVL
jgi:hypothetical protein